MTHDEIMKSKISIVSGWATGGAILYIIFAEKLKLPTGYIFIIDSFFSVFLSVFFMIIVAAFSVGLQALSRGEDIVDNTGWFVALQRVMIVLGLIIGGLLILKFSSNSIEASKTATVLGAMLTGSGILIAFSMTVRLLRKVDWRR